jgi:hypothetical protein
MDHFKKTMTFQAADKSVYSALTNSIFNWWTEMFEGVSNEQGQSFTVRFGPNVFKKIVVDVLIKNKKVVWHVTDSMIDIPELKNKTEWINTKIIWEITSKDNQTVLQLTHEGLTPEIECFTICESGWHSFTDSLSTFINNGIGNAYRLNS